MMGRKVLAMLAVLRLGSPSNVLDELMPMHLCLLLSFMDSY